MNTERFIEFERNLSQLQEEVTNLKTTVQELSVTKNQNNTVDFEINNKSEYRIVNNMKELLIKKGMSQIELAKRIGISEKTINNIVSNRYNTSLSVALKVSYILEEPMANIFKLKVIVP